ncbi:MAG: tryptophan--tRNA ligase [Tissierellia bacterium]|nr:tryptophan--tRNA ligase [Tissierellia bacterium]
MNKERVFSGIQPSGSITIGNYIGALSNFKEFQDDFDCLYCIVDMHSLSNEQKPSELRKNTLDLLALYLAAGLNPEKSTVFIQSHVPAHAELQWVLNSVVSVGHLERMTQYKDKAQKQSGSIPATLLNYPILMAADILLYQAKYVPVGEDQKQHIEITRDIAERFNYRYSDTFVLPEIILSKSGKRIMSLQDPTVKMSKSDENPNGSIRLLDSPDDVRRKLKRAVTDSLGNFDYNDEQLGLKNLIDIYSAFTKETVEDIVNFYKDLGYGRFKSDLGEIIAEEVRDIQVEYNNYISDKAQLEKIYREGAEKASYMAEKTLRKVYKKVGFVAR